MTVDASAIAITANDVTRDLNGHVLTGTGIGVELNVSGNCVVEMNVEDNGTDGILVNAHSVVRGCIARNNGDASPNSLARRIDLAAAEATPGEVPAELTIFTLQ